LLRPSQGRVTRYTLPSLLQRPCGMAHTMTDSLLETFRYRRCIDSTWFWQVTGVPAWARSLGHNKAVSSTFSMDFEELASSRASTTRQGFPSPSNCPNVSSSVIAGHHPLSSVIAGHHPLAVNHSFPLEIARNILVLHLLNQLQFFN